MASKQIHDQRPRFLRLRRLRRRVLNVRVIWYIISIAVAAAMVIGLILPAFI